MSQTDPSTVAPTDELLKFAGHYRYEREMFRAMLSRLDPFEKSAQQNAFIESFLIHTRNLIEFYFKPSSGDDLHADKYFDALAEWEAARGPQSDFLKETLRKINKTLAHMTKVRLDRSPYDVNWNARRIEEHLSPAFDAFDRLVADRHEWHANSLAPKSPGAAT